MLNIQLIETSMKKLGLSGAAVAEACEVSREATSNWLNGESIPRPSKLTKLAAVLQVQVEQLLALEAAPKPIFAYRTARNKPVSGSAKESATELARHLEQLLPYVSERSESNSPFMREPSIDEERIRKIARDARASLQLNQTDVLTDKALETLFHTFGACLVPVIWGLDKVKHENALTVYLPESKFCWVVFNLGCKQDDYKYWLAHEYGHCLTLHGLSEEDGETFAEYFAQHLVFPDEVAFVCLEEMRKAEAPMSVAETYSTCYGVSIVTVLKATERLSNQLHGVTQGLLTPRFWGGWNMGRGKVPSMLTAVFGTETPSIDEYVSKSEAKYKTPVFKAIAAFQEAECGRNPAFIAKALNIGLGDAVSLSHALWQPQP
jgi:transcriptional regulator with XRE-family HTH domain/Zn-dependent peptidase ImmA (M78 family)